MKKMIKYVLMAALVGIVPMLAGCESSQMINEYVEYYCSKPQSNRQVLRHTVNASVAPNAVYVECAQDLPTYTGERKND